MKCHSYHDTFTSILSCFILFRSLQPWCLCMRQVGNELCWTWKSPQSTSFAGSSPNLLQNDKLSVAVFDNLRVSTNIWSLYGSSFKRMNILMTLNQSTTIQYRPWDLNQAHPEVLDDSSRAHSLHYSGWRTFVTAVSPTPEPLDLYFRDKNKWRPVFKVMCRLGAEWITATSTCLDHPASPPT